MPIYRFQCECGTTAEAYFDAEEDKHVDCMACGARMHRDWSSILIGGDLPSRYTVTGDNGKTYYGIRAHEKDAEARGMHLYADGDAPEDRIMKEADYREKHAAPGDRALAQEQTLRDAKEFRRNQRRKLVRERIAKVKVEPPRGFDINLGET